MPIDYGTNNVVSSGNITAASGNFTALLQNGGSVASLPTSGLTITRSGDWLPSSPVRVFFIVPAQAFQFGNTYARYSGKWITSWSYSESSWVTGQSRITSLTFDDLEGVEGTFNPNSMAAITTLSLPALSYVGSSFQPNTMNALTTLSVPALSYVGSNVQLTNMAALTTLSLPALIYVGNSFTISGTAALTTLSLPALSYVTLGVSVTAPALTTLSLPALTFAGSFVGSAITVATGTALTTLSLPALERIIGPSVNITASPALANVTLPVDGRLKLGGTQVTITGAALTQASVNNILQAYAALDGTNNTTSFTGTINLSGGTSAAPSNLGSTTTAGSNFVCAGTTCTVNWTGHGYATGDVLRISGITTATNANRYAVITVVNANQFTYTITSQTATGAGTATVVLAGASAKTLVTRGVTLTTN